MTAGVAIIGGAIMGSFCAWSLRQAGFAGQITVVEKDPTYRFSSTALSAAAIRTQFGTPVNIAMSLHAIDLFRRIKAVFGAGADIGYREKGYLILGGPETVDARRAAARMQRSHGADILALTPDEIADRFPFLDLDGVGIGTFGASGEGWFDAWSLLSLVRAAAKAQGVTYVTGEASGFDLSSGRITGLRIGDQTLSCSICILAAGAASGALMARLDQPLPVSPRKRTVFNFRAPVRHADFPMLFDTSGIWIRPEGEGYIGGIQPSHDPEATGDFEPDHHLLEGPYWPALATRIPAMEELRLERSWAGHYEVNALDPTACWASMTRSRTLSSAPAFPVTASCMPPPRGAAWRNL
ncbi:NAD(P)/FAD-dependent oxidoreductase [Tabrizicola sp.]|uniref:NAD(P)/FAD-dependent oxidoreductase n=1 Tax=Tabrizicola sp. TaxID=2005166 RepID=UPI002FDC8433